jgi:chemotaxis protein histidine kinase CheA
MIETDLGCVTAYADAVAQGYTGTRKEFGQVLANFADSATQVAKDRTAVETAKKSVEVMQSDVTQKQETAASNMNAAVEAAGKAKQSASDAETSKQAAAQSEHNINNTVTAFDNHVEEKIAGFDSRVFEAVEQSKEEINTTKQQAIDTITNQQDASVNIVKTEGEKIITKVGNDAKTVADDRAAVEEATQTVLNNAQEVAQNTQTVASNTEKAAASAESAKTSADNAAQSAKSVEDASKQIEQNKKDVDSLKEDLSNKITKFYASNQGEIHITDSDNGKIQDMMIYGKSSQDGTPTPENPVEIKSVVNPTVKVCGKNLWNPILGGYISGIDGSIAAASKKQIAATDFIKTSGKDITVIARNFSSAMGISYAYRIGFYNAEKKWIKNAVLSDGNKHSINTFDITGTEYIRVSAPSGIYDTIQIEYGSEATPYEPYTEQSVQLPYTLNAIPVTSGGNVTIDGQQYIADYVDVERGKLVKMVDSSKLDNTQSIVNKTEWLLAEPQETDLTTGEITAFKALATYYPTTNISVNSEQLDGYTVFNYPVSMQNGWNYVKQQLNDNRDYIYDMDTKTQDIDTQAAEAYVNSEYAVALTELEV